MSILHFWASVSRTLYAPHNPIDQDLCVRRRRISLLTKELLKSNSQKLQLHSNSFGENKLWVVESTCPVKCCTDAELLSSTLSASCPLAVPFNPVQLRFEEIVNMIFYWTIFQFDNTGSRQSNTNSRSSSPAFICALLTPLLVLLGPCFVTVKFTQRFISADALFADVIKGPEIKMVCVTDSGLPVIIAFNMM